MISATYQYLTQINMMKLTLNLWLLIQNLISIVYILG